MCLRDGIHNGIRGSVWRTDLWRTLSEEGSSCRRRPPSCAGSARMMPGARQNVLPHPKHITSHNGHNRSLGRRSGVAAEIEQIDRYAEEKTRFARHVNKSHFVAWLNNLKRVDMARFATVFPGVLIVLFDFRGTPERRPSERLLVLCYSTSLRAPAPDSSGTALRLSCRAFKSFLPQVALYSV